MVNMKNLIFVFFIVSSSLIAQEEGQDNQIVTTFKRTLIQEQKDLEKGFVASQRIQTLGLLAGGLAHDVNNQLTAIIGQINLCRSLLHQPEQLEKRLTIAEESVFHCAEIAKDLLRVSKGEETKHEDLDLKTLIDKTSNLLRHLVPANCLLLLKLSI